MRLAALILTGLFSFGLSHLVFEAGVRKSSPTRFLGSQEKAFVKVALSFVFLSWTGVTLGEAGLFTAYGLLIAVFLMAVVVSIALAHKGRFPSVRPTVSVDEALPVLLVLVAIAAFLYFPPFQTHLIARDPSTYQFAGSQLARGGGHAFSDELVSGLDDRARDYFFPGEEERAHDGPRYMGFYVEDRDTGRIVAQGLPFLPVWVAIGYLAGESDGALRANAFLAILSAAAMYFLGRRLAHPIVGVGASVLLAGNFAQAWQARYGAAEVAAQALVLIGLYGLIMYRRHGDRFFGLLAGCSLGLTWFAKAELSLLVIPLAVLLLSDLMRGWVDRGALVFFWSPLVAMGVHASVHAYSWSWPYMYDMTLVLRQEIASLLLIFVAALSVVAAAVVVWRWGGPWLDRAEGFLQGSSPSGRSFRRFMTGLIPAVAAYAYWLRPIGPTADLWQSFTMVDLHLAVGGPTLLMAVLGMILTLHDRGAQRGLGAITSFMLLGTVVVLAKPLVQPDLMWALRRFLPLVLPTTFLLAAYGWWRLWILVPQWTRAVRPNTSAMTRGTVRWAGRVAATALLVVVVGVGADRWAMARQYATHVEIPETAAILQAIDREIAPGGIILYEARSRSGLVRLEAPLDFLHGHPGLRLQTHRPDTNVLRNFVHDQESNGRKVYLITSARSLSSAGRSPPMEYFSRPRAVPLARFRFEATEMERAMHRLPKTSNTLRFEFNLYRLDAHKANEPLPGKLNVGVDDEIYTGGFHAPEAQIHRTGNTTTFRWTTDTSRVWLPGLTEKDCELRLFIGTDYPGVTGRHQATMTLDGLRLDPIRLEEGFREYTVRLPNGWRAAEDHVPELVIRTDLWRPADFGRPGDDRQVGVKLARIRWDSQDNPGEQ